MIMPKDSTSIEIRRYSDSNGSLILARDQFNNKIAVREGQSAYDLLNSFDESQLTISLEDMIKKAHEKDFEYFFQMGIFELNYYKEDILMSQVSDYTYKNGVFKDLKNRFEDIKSSYDEVDHSFYLFDFSSSKDLNAKYKISHNSSLEIDTNTSVMNTRYSFPSKASLIFYPNDTRLTLLGIDYDANQFGDDILIAMNLTEIII